MELFCNLQSALCVLFLNSISITLAPLTLVPRSVLWRDNNRIVVFPPMSSFPAMEVKAKTDFLAWVGSGTVTQHVLLPSSAATDGQLP